MFEPNAGSASPEPQPVTVMSILGLRLPSAECQAAPCSPQPPLPPISQRPGESCLSQSSSPDLDFPPPTKEKSAPPHIPTPHSQAPPPGIQLPAARRQSQGVTQLSHCPQAAKPGGLLGQAPPPGPRPTGPDSSSVSPGELCSQDGGGRAGWVSVSPEGAGPTWEAALHPSGSP